MHVFAHQSWTNTCQLCQSHLKTDFNTHSKSLPSAHPLPQAEQEGPGNARSLWEGPGPLLGAQRLGVASPGSSGSQNTQP